jgi:predicted transcriptional regulator
VLEALRRAGQSGLTRTEISNRLGRNRSADQIDRALNHLLKLALARQELEKDTGGRAAERWFKK